MLGAVRVTSNDLSPLIVKVANTFNVDPNLVKAIIQQESAWDTNASRYEVKLQDSSWGLMQVLLSTAKNVLGNKNLTISELVNPEVNITIGTKYFAQQLSRYGGNIKDALAAYNAGTAKKTSDGRYINQDYVDSAYRHYMTYKVVGAPLTVQTASIGIGAIGLLLVGMLIIKGKHA